MALGSDGSRAVASSSHCPKSLKGSSAAVKSPTVNRFGCSIGAASDMCWSTRMAGPGARRVFRPSLYSGTAGASLRFAAVLALAGRLGGCAVSNSMFAKSSSKDEAAAKSAYAGEDVTGSVATPRATPVSATTTGLPSETDLVFARMAVVDVLKRGSKEISAPWENPSSGARGTVTPIASAYVKDG